jgi:hypothetical protein
MPWRCRFSFLPVPAGILQNEKLRKNNSSKFGAGAEERETETNGQRFINHNHSFLLSPIIDNNDQ